MSFTVLIIVSYAIIVVLGYKMFNYTRENLDSAATSKKRVDRINKQFTKNLLVQVKNLIEFDGGKAK